MRRKNSRTWIPAFAGMTWLFFSLRFAPNAPIIVIPANAGIQAQLRCGNPNLDSRPRSGRGQALRGNDKIMFAGMTGASCFRRFAPDTSTNVIPANAGIQAQHS
jgi:hypothetical protein